MSGKHTDRLQQPYSFPHLPQSNTKISHFFRIVNAKLRVGIPYSLSQKPRRTTGEPTGASFQTALIHSQSAQSCFRHVTRQWHSSSLRPGPRFSAALFALKHHVLAFAAPPGGIQKLQADPSGPCYTLEHPDWGTSHS